ncbi:MAG TPA: hypothetical protein VNH40_11485 [Gaiellaceae bacterium]|nr:hypothetical protein [Gaiellaceae bacterium]
MTRRLLHRRDLADEQGVAIVLAVVVIAIITIAAASAIYYTDGSQRDAFYKKGGQTAYSLAQAAISTATARLVPHYYDDTGQPFDNSTELSDMVSYAPAGSQQSPDDTSACTSSPVSTCMSWSSELECPTGVTCSSGAPSYSPPGDERARWHITGIGTVPNPSGTQPITRTITIDVPLVQPPSKAGAPDIFKSIYSGKVSSGCDLSTGQNVIWAAPVYVRGNMCIGQNSGVEKGSQGLGKLNVGGWLETSGNGAHVGATSTPLPSLAVSKICTTSSTVPPPNADTDPPCADTLSSYANGFKDSAGTVFVSTASDTPSFPSPPSINWDNPTAPNYVGGLGTWSCTGGRSLAAPSGGTFVLNGSAYECTIETDQIPTGYLKWDGTTLTINGNVFINGNLITDSTNQQMLYDGLGTIYVGGTVSFANNTAICHDQVDNTGHDCPHQEDWPNIADNFLLIAAKDDMSGGQSNSNFSIEGGLYSEQQINFGAGHTNIYGPIVTPDQIFPGQQAASGFPNIIDLFTGLPGTPQPFWVMALPENGTY